MTDKSYEAAGFSDAPVEPEPAAPAAISSKNAYEAAGFSDQPPPESDAVNQEEHPESFLDRYLPGWRKAKADTAGQTLGQTLWDTSPGRLAQALKSAFVLPHQMMTGEVKPGSPEEIAGAANLATLALPTGAARATAAEGPAIARVRGLGIPETAAEDLTSGQRAAATTQALGEPMPAGLASDSPTVQSATAKFQQIPWAGQKISSRMARSAGAAAEKVQGIATDLGATERAAADVTARRGVDDTIAANKARISNAYDELRANIDPDQPFDMPSTRAALATVLKERTKAGEPNPNLGLEQTQNVVNGVNGAGGFNGVHKLRADLRDAGNPADPHPGYDAGQFRLLKSAVDADLKNGVRSVAADPNTAESLYNSAEITAQQYINENKALRQLQGAKGEGVISSIINATKEKGGNLRTIAALRRDMAPDDFAQLSGTFLNELGKGANGFSLAKFATEWGNKTSAGAKNVMFSPEHRKWLDNISSLGQHVKNVDQYVNHSNTSGALMLFELMKAGAEGVGAVAGGLVKPAGAIGAIGYGAVVATPALYLSRPATAAVMSKWVTAYRAASLGVPSPARIAQLKIATQNLANTLGVSPDMAWNIVAQNAPTRPANREPTSTQPLRITVHKQPSPQGQAKDQSRMVPAGTR